jgi:hypothetical protein
MGMKIFVSYIKVQARIRKQDGAVHIKIIIID